MTRKRVSSQNLAKKRGLPMDELNHVVRTLAEGRKLAAKFRDHQLVRRYKGCRECHI
jgi:mRNA interferase YafQ